MVGGVPVYVASSWWLVAVLITVFFADTVSALTGVQGVLSYVAALALAVLLAVSVLVHEAAHAAAARAFRLPVSEVVVDLWGGHTMLARPVTPASSALVSVLGPVANLALAALGWGVQQSIGPQEPGSLLAVVSFLLLGTALTNVLVGAFNLLPGLPLDGGRVLEALVWRLSGDQDTATVVAAWVGRAGAVAVGVASVLLVGRLGTFTVVWLLLLCVFLWRGASASLTVGSWRRRAARVDVRSLGIPVLAVSRTASVSDVERLLGAPTVPPDAEVVLVDDSGRPVAVLTAASVDGVPAHLRPSTPASALGVAVPASGVLAHDAGSAEILEALARSGSLGIVLLDGPGRPVARVDPARFAAAMGMR